MKITIAALFFVCLGVSTAVNAQVFKCSLPDGTATYSDKPCSGSNTEKLDLRFKVDRTAPRSTPTPKSPDEGVEQPSTDVLLKQPPELVKPPADISVPPENRLATACVEHYKKHLAYPMGVRILSKQTEKNNFETKIIVNVKTISSPSTPIQIDPIFIDEKFICFSDDGVVLNERNTTMYSNRHKKGERL